MIIVAIAIFLICVGIVLTIGFLSNWYNALYTGIGLLLGYIAGLAGYIKYKKNQSYAALNKESLTLKHEDAHISDTSHTQALINIANRGYNYDDDANSVKLQYPETKLNLNKSDLIGQISKEVNNLDKLDMPEMPEIPVEIDNTNYDIPIIDQISLNINLNIIERQKDIINNEQYAILIGRIATEMDNLKKKNPKYKTYLNDDSNARRIIKELIKKINVAAYENRSQFAYNGDELFIYKPFTPTDFEHIKLTRQQTVLLSNIYNRMRILMLDGISDELDDYKYVDKVIYKIFTYLGNISDLDATIKDIVTATTVNALCQVIINIRSLNVDLKAKQFPMHKLYGPSANNEFKDQRNIIKYIKKYINTNIIDNMHKIPI